MANEPKATESFSEPAKRPSKAWYLVPIFFGIVGGLVMYLVLKDTDRKMAKNGIILSIILTVVIFAISVVVGVLMVLLHPFTPKLSAAECDMYKAEVAKSAWPMTATRKLMADGGCTPSPQPSSDQSTAQTPSPSPQPSSDQSTAQTPSPSPQPSSHISLTISTDKSSYFSGETVTPTVVFSGINQQQNIQVDIKDPTGSTVVSKTATTDITGVASLQFNLPSSAQSGSYQAVVTSSYDGNEWENSATFYLQQNRSPSQ